MRIAYFKRFVFKVNRYRADITANLIHTLAMAYAKQMTVVWCSPVAPGLHLKIARIIG